MSPKKSAAKSDNKRKAPEAEEAAAPVSASGSAGADGSAVVAFEKTKKQPLDAGDSKRFKAHANYTSTNAKATEEDREFASRALELYKNGTQEQKHKILCTFRVDKTYKWTTSFAEETVDAVANKTQYRGGWLSKHEDSSTTFRLTTRSSTKSFATQLWTVFRPNLTPTPAWPPRECCCTTCLSSK